MWVADKELKAMKYEFLPHTADIRMRIQGNDPEDLFKAGVRGMASVLQEGICSNQEPPELERSLVLESPDRTSLLIDFLSEVLTLCYVENAVFCAVRFNKLNGTGLECTVYGFPINRLDEEIKAVTYTEARVVQTEGGTWVSDVVFDI